MVQSEEIKDSVRRMVRKIGNEEITEDDLLKVKAFDELPHVQSLCVDGSKLDEKYRPANKDIKYSDKEEFFLIG